MSGVDQVGLKYVGELPDGWRIVPAGTACKKVTDGTHDTPKVFASGVPFVTAVHIKNGSIDFSKCQHVDEETHRTIFARCDPRRGDLTVVNIGAGVGECGYVDVDFEFSLKNVALLKPDPAVLDGEFLFHLHQSRKLRIAHVVKAGGAQPFLSLAELRRMPIILPPLLEQKRIAAVLGTWDRAIETVEALIANAREQKQALMQQLLPQGTNPPKKRLAGFSGEWRERTIKQFGKVESGGTPASGNLAYWGGDIAWVTPSEITKLHSRHLEHTERTITKEGLAESSAKLLPIGTVIVCTRATVGDLAIATTPMTTNQGFKNIVPNEQHDSEFLYYLLAFNKKALIRAAAGSTFAEVSKTDFEKLGFVVPERPEQRSIASALVKADEVIERRFTQLTALRQEKAALMQQLLTGKRRVKLSESEVVE